MISFHLKRSIFQLISSVFLASLAMSAMAENEDTCGFDVATGNYASWRNGYLSWVTLSNVSGDTAVNFNLWLDIGDTHVRKSRGAKFESFDGGYAVSSPPELEQNIDPGGSYTIGFIGEGRFDGVTPYIIAINGEICDQIAPEISLNSSQNLFTSDNSLILTAVASDNIAVRKVVFHQNDVEIATKTEEPFTLDVEIESSLNGRQIFTATAYDPTGNQVTSSTQSVLVAIGNRFLGTAPSGDADYADLNTYFNQLTPENASKWGEVEAVRDEMNWTDLDTAYAFAQDNGVVFKFHTLIWGQQAPGWITDLPLEEQLEEIEEWMALVAERYPDIALIDVVNEPLHAPPAYLEALGGSGSTGWDWVIKSFELARQYFPQSELILNDYQILILENFTSDYLNIINLLQERGLIDGIGLQGHFLEQADISVVAINLESLAATGLPIYVSEFDVNFADDARHANRLKDLFTTFWNNPSVLGVTHWGHLEGDVWRTDSFLIHADGTTRPGMDWLICFYEGGEDCSVPEYIPPGWDGGEFGLTLEAELYDDGQGVAALGGVVAFTDDGDWINFQKVNFQENWDTFWVTYAKGNTDVGSISIHLDSLENDPVLTVVLEPTAGWGSNDTLEFPLSVTGQRDVYIQFNDVGGVANLDSIRFGTPAPAGDVGSNLVSNGGFEDGTTTGWFSWDGTLSATSDVAQSGDYSLKLTDRSGNGPAVYGLFGLVNAGSTYQVSMQVSVGGAASADINVTQKIGCDGEDSFTWLINPVAVESGQWVEISGQLVLPDCELTDVLIYAEGPEGGIDIFLDEVSVREELGESIISNGGFEEGATTGWFSWDGTVSATTEFVNTGEYSLLLSERSGNGPAAYNLTSLVELGRTYSVSMAVSIGGALQAPINITQKIECDGDANFSWLANSSSVIEGEWTILSGDLVVPDCNLTDLLIYAEGPDGGIDIYIDEVSAIVIP